jgi:hypothetical protein
MHSILPELEPCNKGKQSAERTHEQPQLQWKYVKSEISSSLSASVDIKIVRVCEHMLCVKHIKFHTISVSRNSGKAQNLL